eukprot:scaffold134668_cov38-Prasinocladus_malaysianus.AAC.1
MVTPRQRTQLKMNLNSDKLAASGWGSAKPSARTIGSQAPASGQTTSRTQKSLLDEEAQPKKALEDHINLE